MPPSRLDGAFERCSALRPFRGSCVTGQFARAILRDTNSRTEEGAQLVMVNRLWVVFTVGTVFALLPPGRADEPPGRATYERQVAPFLQKYCADCHGEATREHRWSWETAPGYRERIADQTGWRKAAQLVSSHIMPPHDAESPSREQRVAFVQWIEDVVFHVDPERPDPGPVLMRRLNRAEYNATVRDVLGIAGGPADQFPEDDSGYGFDNIGDVLTISPLHVEKYLAAAGDMADEVTRLENPPRVGLELSGNRLTTFRGHAELHDQQLLLPSPAVEAGTILRVPITSIYRIVTRAAVSRSSDQRLATIEVLSNGRVIAELQPTAEWQGGPGGTSTVFALVPLQAGEHQLGLRVKSPRGDGGAADSRGAIAFLGISGPFTPVPPQASSYLQSLAGDRPLGTPILRLSGEDLDGGSGRTSLDTGRAWFASNGYRHAPVFLEKPGPYRLRFKVGAQQVGDEPVRFEVRLADRTLGPFLVTAEAQAEQWIEAECELPAGQLDWQVWFVNEYQDPHTGAERWFWLHEFTIEGVLPGEYGLLRDEVITALERTGRKLFRRPLAAAERDRVEQLVDAELQRGESPRAALRVALEALLASPAFFTTRCRYRAANRRTVRYRLTSGLWPRGFPTFCGRVLRMTSFWSWPSVGSCVPRSETRCGGCSAIPGPPHSRRTSPVSGYNCEIWSMWCRMCRHFPSSMWNCPAICGARRKWYSSTSCGRTGRYSSSWTRIIRSSMPAWLGTMVFRNLRARDSSACHWREHPAAVWSIMAAF
jgi:hypothetical protein